MDFQGFLGEGSSLEGDLRFQGPFRIDGRVTGNDVFAKAYVALTRLMGRGDDAAIIVVSAPSVPGGSADDTLAEFVRDMEPAISAELRRVRESR